MRKIKLNIALTLIMLTVLVSLFVATTLAYFSDSKHVTNTMTSGNVKIALSESAVKYDQIGNLVADPSKPPIIGGSENQIHNYGKIYPSQTIHKDPTVKNIGSETAWIAFKITVKDGKGDLRKIMGYPNSDHIDIRVFFSGALFSERASMISWNGFEKVIKNDKYAMVQVGSPHLDKYEFYVFLLNPVESGEEITLFDTMTISDEWGNTEMQELSELTLTLKRSECRRLTLKVVFTP